jgi:predicted ABC-type ATPase
LPADCHPLKPELAAIAAARMVLREIDRLASERADFAFETTLSGRTYVRRMEAWKRAGYRIEIVFLRLDSVELALRRIEVRVRQGGMMCPSGTSSDASPAAGKTSKKPTNRWRNLGRCTTIQGRRRN